MPQGMGSGSPSSWKADQVIKLLQGKFLPKGNKTWEVARERESPPWTSLRCNFFFGLPEEVPYAIQTHLPSNMLCLFIVYHKVVASIIMHHFTWHQFFLPSLSFFLILVALDLYPLNKSPALQSLPQALLSSDQSFPHSQAYPRQLNEYPTNSS